VLFEPLRQSFVAFRDFMHHPPSFRIAESSAIVRAFSARSRVWIVGRSSPLPSAAWKTKDTPCSSEKRLARALLLLANFGKDGKHEPVIAKISQETLADTVGTTRSRVSHFMNKFRQLGYINYNGDLEVHSSLLDAVLHKNRK
jgi:predicted XRE-type DNA-binding protein